MGFTPGPLIGTTANPVVPLLGPLADNGSGSPDSPTASGGEALSSYAGATASLRVVPTEAPSSSSPAFSAGLAAGATATDERGFARPANSPSIGAYQPEYAATSDPAQVFVEGLYETLLNRTADPAGLAFWSSQVDAQTGSNSAMVFAFESSGEYRQDRIEQDYEADLGRAGDPSGLQYWTAFLDSGGTLGQAQADFLGSPESKLDHGGNAVTIVESLYEDILGRVPTAAEVDGWVGTLQADGYEFSAVATDFLLSTEGLDELTMAGYTSTFARQAGSNEVGYWVGVLTGPIDPSDPVTLLNAGLDGSSEAFRIRTPVAATTGPLHAQPDSYAVEQGTSLFVAAPGVQANDIATKGGAATCVVVSRPSDGTLVLASDGSFAYEPAAGFGGVDTFTYEDVRGSVTSNVATVTIDVVPQVLVVTNTNDSGPGSLRQAIRTVDTSTGDVTESIRFDIPGTGPFAIVPQSRLPSLTEPTVIDGYSQPGSEANTLNQGDNAVIQIDIQGEHAGFDGLEVSGSDSTVKGLEITGFADGLLLDNSDDTVTGNVISGNSGNGIAVIGASSNVIGGTGAASRNVLSGNRNSGIYLNDSSYDVIQGNYAGTDAAGTASGGSQNYGVYFTNSPHATLGGTAAGAGNLLSGNVDNGALIGNDSDYATVQGNLIGTDVTGTVALANGGGLGVFGSNMLIGGDGTAAGNVISGNKGNGLALTGGGDSADSGDVVQGNRIGVDNTGTHALGNSGYGLILDYTTSATVSATSSPPTVGTGSGPSPKGPGATSSRGMRSART